MTQTAVRVRWRIAAAVAVLVGLAQLGCYPAFKAQIIRPPSGASFNEDSMKPIFYDAGMDTEGLTIWVVDDVRECAHTRVFVKVSGEAQYQGKRFRWSGGSNRDIHSNGGIPTGISRVRNCNHVASQVMARAVVAAWTDEKNGR